MKALKFAALVAAALALASVPLVVAPRRAFASTSSVTLLSVPIRTGDSKNGECLLWCAHTDITARTANTNVLASVFTPAYAGGSRFLLQIQVATSSTVKLITKKSGNSDITSILNDGAALTSGLPYRLGPIDTGPGLTFQLQVGTTTAIDLFALTEYTGTAVAARSSSRAGASDPTLGGDLSGTASAASVVGLTGANGVVTGPTNHELVITAGGTRGLTLTSGTNNDIELNASNGADLRLEGGGGDGVLEGGDGGASVTAGGGANADVSLNPDGTGRVEVGGSHELRSYKVTATNELNGPLMSAGHIYRLPVSYVSATTIKVGPGNCRDSSDAGNIYLAPVNGDQTVSITSVGSLGLDTHTLTATATTDTTTTIVASADIVPELGSRAGVGTMTTSTTSVTGLTDTTLAVGDLIGSRTTYGLAQIAAYNPGAGTATLTNALPGGDATTITFRVIENATLWPGATVGDKRRVATISADGLTVVLSGGAIASNAAGVSLKTSVEVASCWYSVWAATVSGTGKAFLSTKRDTDAGPGPYLFTGLTDYRLIGWVYNDSGGDIVPFSTSGNSSTVTYQWECDSGSAFGLALRVVNGGTTGSAWHRVSCASVVPPGSRRAVLNIQLTANGTAGFRASGIGDAATGRRTFFTTNPAALQLNDTRSVVLDGSSAFDYTSDATLYMDLCQFDVER